MIRNIVDTYIKPLNAETPVSYIFNRLGKIDEKNKNSQN